MHGVDAAIWRKFNVKHGDNLPFCGMQGTRETLAELFAELGYKLGAELGVRRGHFSQILCRANKGLRLLCIDTWAPFMRHSQDQQDKIYESAVVRLSPYDCELIRKSGEEAAREIPDGSLDFVYIDAMHFFDDAMMDLIVWSRKVRRDGIVAGHDYDALYQCGVIPAVHAYTAAHGINLWYVTPQDTPRSYFWRKA